MYYVMTGERKGTQEKKREAAFKTNMKRKKKTMNFLSKKN